jgi:structure-specific recognition protein 1
MTSTYMHMQGAQYAYKIKYDDINSLFLLPKPDGGRSSFVISLEKPIRQGNQKYQHLVLETHKVDHTLAINLSEEEIQSEYDGQLSTEMTMPLSNLIAKVFKVLSQKTVSRRISTMMEPTFHPYDLALCMRNPTV